MTSVQKRVRAVVCMIMSLLLMLTMVTFPADASAMTISKTSYKLTKGYAITLKVTGAGGNVSWSSSDTSVASVSESGQVIGKKVGDAVITAKSGNESVSCNIKVVGGKLQVSKKNIQVGVGEYEYITVRAKGSHGLKVSSGDKSIVTGGWIKPWNKDDIRLRLTGRSAGSTTVKIMLTKFPDVYINLNVTVGSGKATLALSQNTVTTKVDDTASVILYSDNKDKIGYSFSEKGIAQVTEGKWNSNYCTLGIKGLKEGSTVLTVYRKDNTSVKETVKITVSNGTVYYSVSTTVPTKTTSTDLIYRWTNKNVVKYMLVPKDYDLAKINTIVAKDMGKYEYYTVYDSTPSKTLNSDTILNFKATVKNKEETRYILAPAKYDTPSCNSAIAEYTGEYKYWTVYITQLDTHKIYTNDVIKSWTTVVNNKTVTRYILLPFDYSESKLQAIIDDDKGNEGGYYTVSTTKPTISKAGDSIIEFQAYVENKYLTCYILVPAGYDEAKVNDAKAAFIGKYDYYSVYTVNPVKLSSSDIIMTWDKLIDSKLVKRYILLPLGYSESLFQSIKAKDLETSTSAYYSISTKYPALSNTTDIVYTWYNAKEKVYKYMLLPAKYDPIKRNDLILKDTGETLYYTFYSTQPAKKVDTDTISYYSYNGNMAYMLVPKDADQAKVDQAFKELSVNS